MDRKNIYFEVFLLLIKDILLVKDKIACRYYSRADRYFRNMFVDRGESLDNLGRVKRICWWKVERKERYPG